VKKIFILLVVLLLAHSAEASVWQIVPDSDWELVAENQDFKFYIDTLSIQEERVSCSSRVCFPWYGNSDSYYPPDNAVKAWIKKIRKAPKQYESVKELDYQEHDCTTDRSRLLHLTKCYPDGMSESFNLNFMITWDDIPPDKIAQFIHKYLCRYK